MRCIPLRREDRLSLPRDSSVQSAGIFNTSMGWMQDIARIGNLQRFDGKRYELGSPAGKSVISVSVVMCP
jgi:hypothetical protein